MKSHVLYVKKNDLPDFFDIPVRIDDNSWYINLPSNNSKYYIDLIQFMYGEEKILTTSNIISSPSRTIENIDEDLLLLTGIYDFKDDSFDDKNTAANNFNAF